MKPKLLLYLHGYMSSPNSYKAQHLKEETQKRYPQIKTVIPKLSSVPYKAWEAVERLLDDHKEYEISVVGASMGGLLASRISALHNVKAVLINPLIPTAEVLLPYTGVHTNPYTGEEFELSPHDLHRVVSLQPSHFYRDNLWVLLETGDNTFDYKRALRKYNGAKISVEDDGDHSFTKFTEYLPQIYQFFGL